MNLVETLTYIYNHNLPGASVIGILTDNGNAYWLNYIACLSQSGVQTDITIGFPVKNYVNSILKPFPNIQLIAAGSKAAFIGIPTKEAEQFCNELDVTITFDANVANVTVASANDKLQFSTIVNKEKSGWVINMQWPDYCGINGNVLLDNKADTQFAISFIPLYPMKSIISKLETNKDFTEVLEKTMALDNWYFADTNEEKIASIINSILMLNKYV